VTASAALTSGCGNPVHLVHPKTTELEQKPVRPVFGSLRRNIFRPKCTGCHKPGGKAERTPLLTRDDFINNPDQIVVPGKPEDSALMFALDANARKPMPPPDSGIEPLTKEQINVIEEWIRLGAP
jgi:hypothetical protein